MVAVLPLCPPATLGHCVTAKDSSPRARVKREGFREIESTACDLGGGEGDIWEHLVGTGNVERIGSGGTLCVQRGSNRRVQWCPADIDTA